MIMLLSPFLAYLIINFPITFGQNYSYIIRKIYKNTGCVNSSAISQRTLETANCYSVKILCEMEDANAVVVVAVIVVLLSFD